MKKTAFPFYYGWVIVGISFSTLFFSLGLRYSFSVFFIAIITEYGWSRAETAGAFSLAMLVHGLIAPVTGALIDRLGPRKLFPMGSALLIAGLVAASQTTAVWHLYLFFGVLVAIGINTLSYAPHMSLIPKWFIRKRGLATGLVLAGTGMGTLVIVPMTELMIDGMGWRFAFLFLGGLILLTVLPMNALFQRRSPEEVGQKPDGIMSQSNMSLSPKKGKSGSINPASNPEGQWTLKAALYTRAFWYIALVVFCTGFFINMLLVHQAIHIVDVGYSKMMAASLVGTVGIIGSVGGIFCGYLSDRVGREISFTLAGAVAFAGVLLFLSMRDAASPWMLYTYVIFYGMGYASMITMSASATGDLFPGNSLGRILALQSIGFGVGGALGPYLGGYCYDRWGSYSAPFLLVLGIICIAVIAIWRAAPRRRRDIAKAFLEGRAPDRLAH